MIICVSDVDGTIVDSYGELSSDTISTLIDFQDKGNKLILASGRSYLRMMPIAKKLKMDFYNGYLIDVNGLSIYNFSINKRTIISRLSKEELYKLFEYSKNLDVEVKLYCDDAIYTYLPEHIYLLKSKIRKEMILPNDYPWTSGEYGWLADYRDGYPIQSLISNIDEINHEVNKIGLCHDSDYLYKVQENFKNSIFSSKYEIKFSGHRQLDIIPKNISKGKALTNVLEEIDASIDEVYIFGDSENDISMLNLSNNSYVMENSKIKDKENYYNLTSSNDNNGVANIIKYLIK